MPQSHNAQSLSERIKQSVTTGDTVKDTLATSQRIIARVTDGIYREPWAAFRELIANAYDADARRVIIETGAPDFAQVSVRDDGNGMSAETLAYVVKNIGGSSKRTARGATLHTANANNPDLSPGGRPLIGKIGIGLFAVAQLTQHFQIITKAAGEDIRTSATIKLLTHDEERLKNADEEGNYVAGEVQFTTERVPISELDSHGTAIVLYSLRSEIRRSLQSLGRWQVAGEKGDDGRPVKEQPSYHIGLLPGVLSSSLEGISPALPWKPTDSPLCKFRALYSAAADVSGRGGRPANLEHFDEYLRLIWQLSLSLPLQYVKTHPFDLTGGSPILFFGMPSELRQAVRLSIPAGETVREALSLTAGAPDPIGGFTVIVDEVELRRPIDLPESLREKSRIPAPVMLVANVGPAFKGSELERAGGQLKFEAYLYWNSKIIPKDTSGVIVRVREASGTLFDPDFLRYQVSEQTRLRQITAEIFVTEGLDSAINIDRESFNYSHPHYIYIQKWLHRALRLLVNRLKAIADEDLQKEKALRQEKQSKSYIASALDVWRDRRGESADVPVVPLDAAIKPFEIGNAEVDLSASGSDARAVALAVVLESYGLLSLLSRSDRSRLIADLLAVLDQKQ